MTAELETLITEEMIERKDKWSDPRVSPPISESDIRKWAIAVYWPETPPPMYWDEDYAVSTRYGGIIAPPDFNPFAWPAQREPSRPDRETPQGGGVGTRGMNGGQTDEYVTPMRPRDVISATSALIGWNERNTRLGLTLFSTNETRWTNQNGELVKSRKSVSIRY